LPEDSHDNITRCNNLTTNSIISKRQAHISDSNCSAGVRFFFCSPIGIEDFEALDDLCVSSDGLIFAIRLLDTVPLFFIFFYAPTQSLT
jgi:hypothetical protein